MLSTIHETTPNARVEDAVCDAFEDAVWAGAMARLHRYGDHIQVGAGGRSMMRAFEACCEAAADDLAGMPATEEELF